MTAYANTFQAAFRNRAGSAIIHRLTRVDGSSKPAIAAFKAANPDLRFEGYVYDLENSGDRDSLKLYFLSPNRWGVKVWVKEPNGVIWQRMFKREETDGPIFTRPVRA